MSAHTARAERIAHVLSGRWRGSSSPVVVETGAGRSFVKPHGAGQGPAALVAEVIVGARDRGVRQTALRAVPDEFVSALLSAATAGTLARRREACVAFLWNRLKPPCAIAAGQGGVG